MLLQNKLLITLKGAAKRFHEQMLLSAMRAPVAFYDTTPIGRILNRFTKDIADVDQMVPPTLSMFIFSLLLCSNSKRIFSLL